ncbi:MAG: hypothetical protein L0J35_01625 [Tetragenococcus halophilus]|nr:hypothetical protein [Tetragenococcus halophilus]
MSLLDTLKAVKDEGYDPRTDKINNRGLLPAGRYPVRLLTSEHDVNMNNNRERVVLTLQVTAGDSKDRQEKLFLVFDNDLPEFVVQQNAKILLSIAEFVKVDFTEADLANTETTAQALKKGIGNQFLMDLKVRPNKKNPDYPYRNYEFSELPQANSEDFKVGEDPLPF